MFKLEGLIDFLHHRRFKIENRGHLIQMIRDMGGDASRQNIRKSDGTRSIIRYWYIPSFEENKIELPIKEMSDDIPF